MRVLVTGGAGYIGSHVVEVLLERGYQVVVYDNLSGGYRAAVHADAVFVQGDLRDAETLETVFHDHRFDGILHFASHIEVGESMRLPFKYLGGNVAAMTQLLETATRHKVPRFILSSTAALFGRPERIPIDEDERIWPGSVYGEAKWFCERQLHWMEEIYGLDYCCLRYFNASGAHPKGHIGEAHDPETHLIPIVLQVALGQRDQVSIFGRDYATPDGTCVRDYIHVMDLAEAHVLAFEALGGDGCSRAYNLGSGDGYSVLELIEMARKVTGHPIPSVFGDRRPGDPPTLVADSSRIERELGWKRSHSDLTNIVETAWRWQRAHPHGYGKAS